MHLDTVFIFCDRDLVTVFADVVNGIRAFSLRPGDKNGQVDVGEEARPLPEVVAEALGLKELRIVETGGDAYPSFPSAS